MRKGPEAALKAKVIPLLKASGLLWWRNNSGMVPIAFPGKAPRFMQTGTKGLPDIMLFGSDGYLWCLELKAPKGKLSPEQEAFRDRVRGLSARFFVVRTAEQAVDIIQAAQGESNAKFWEDIYNGEYT
jgi:hypothetical protein